MGSSRSTPLTVPALRLRSRLGQIMDRMESESRPIVVEKRGVPKAVLMSLRDYVRLAAPEPEVLRLIGAEAQRKGKHRLSAKQIDEVVAKARGQRRRPK